MFSEHYKLQVLNFFKKLIITMNVYYENSEGIKLKNVIF